VVILRISAFHHSLHSPDFAPMIKPMGARDATRNHCTAEIESR